MSDIPTQAFHEILHRLPTGALPGFRGVCKSWRRIIDDYLRLQVGNNHLIFKISTGKKLQIYSIPLTSLCFSDSDQPIQIEATKVTTIVRSGIPAMPKSLPVSSCHGLILLWSSRAGNDWAIWNPLTKECFELPSFDDFEPRGIMARGGIGYDRVTDDYKVVRVSQISFSGDGRYRHGLETIIYSMESDEWHRIAVYPNCLLREGVNVRDDFGLFANGAIHWVMWLLPADGTEVETIISLDLSSESYRQLPMPLREDKKQRFGNSLKCLNESLVLSHSYAEKFDVWMMKESSWVKFFSFNKVYDAGMYIANPELVAYIESTKHALIQSGGKFLWYDIENKCGKILKVGSDWESISSQVFPVCRVRLPGNEGVAESAALKRKRKSSKERLRLMLTSTADCFSPETSLE